MFWLGIVTGYFGITLPLLTLTWFNELVVALGGSAEPALSAVIAYIAGLEPLPGAWTFFGGTLAFIGLFLVAKYSQLD